MKHRNYLRHHFGNGKIFDDSECCENSITSRNTSISNQSSVWLSKIINSQISHSTITNSNIIDSWVTETCVTGGTIQSSAIKCELITGKVKIKNSIVSGASRIAHNAILRNVKIKNLTVKGNAKLIDWHKIDDENIFNGLMGYVSRGTWKRPPRVVRFPFGVTVTESIEGYAYVACREYSIVRWLEIGERFGKARGWNLTQINQVREILENWIS